MKRHAILVAIATILIAVLAAFLVVPYRAQYWTISRRMGVQSTYSLYLGTFKTSTEITGGGTFGMEKLCPAAAGVPDHDEVYQWAVILRFPWSEQARPLRMVEVDPGSSLKRACRTMFDDFTIKYVNNTRPINGMSGSDILKQRAAMWCSPGFDQQVELITRRCADENREWFAVLVEKSDETNQR